MCVSYTITYTKKNSGFEVLICFSPAVAQETLRQAVSDTRNQDRSLIADTDPCLGAKGPLLRAWRSFFTVPFVMMGAGRRSATPTQARARSPVSELKQPGHISARPGLGAVQGPRPGPQPQGRGGHGTAGRKHEPGSRTPPESPPGLERLILFQFFISLYII